MQKVYLWFFVFAGGLLGPIFIYRGVVKISRDGPSFKFSDIFRDKPVRDTSGTILILEGVFVIICAAVLLFVIVKWL